MYMYPPKRTVVNPYIHFGQPSVWPRGLPLDMVSSNSPERAYDTLDLGVTPLIKHGLVEGDADVDAIFRLTRIGR